jgi:hypothetical protein
MGGKNSKGEVKVLSFGEDIGEALTATTKKLYA